MKTGLFWYKFGWKHCIELLKEMSKDDSYDSWYDMIAELEERVEKHE